MADEYTFAKSLAPQDTDFEFDTRQFIYIPDQNNSSYPNGQVQFDLAGLSNSGKFIDWSQSFIQVPLSLMSTHLPVLLVVLLLKTTLLLV